MVQPAPINAIGRVVERTAGTGEARHVTIFTYRGVSALAIDETNALGPPAFGRYRVLNQAGRGVLGPVFRTHDLIHDRLIAVTSITLDIVPEPEDVTRLTAALRDLIARPVDHRGAINVIAAGHEGGRPYFATDYVAGEWLDLGLRRLAPMALNRAVDLLRSLAEVIDAAWEAGVGHGALHPRDVVLMGDGSGVRVTGIGIALALHRAGRKAPVRRPYTAPERGDGRTWSPAADVYSIGAIAHELLTGRRLDAAEQQGEFAALIPDQRAPVRRILARALAMDPVERFHCARAFVHALEAVAADALPAVPPQPTSTAEPQLPPSGSGLSRPPALVAATPAAVLDVPRAPAPAPSLPARVTVPPPAEPLLLRDDLDLRRPPVLAAATPLADLELQRAAAPAPPLRPRVTVAPPAVRPPSTQPVARFPWGAIAAGLIAILLSGSAGWYAVRLRPAGAPAAASDTPTVTEVHVSPESPAVPQPQRGALSGSWVLTHRVEQSTVAAFRDLTLSFRLELNQDGNRLSGQGLKWEENGRRLPTRGRTPITVTGTMEGNTVVLSFTERGTRRTSHGRLQLQLTDDGVLHGRFSSGAGQSSGRARAVRVSSS